MKTRFLSLSLALGAVLFTAGCDTIGEPLAARFDRPAVERMFEAPESRVFEAAVAALKEMGYTIRSARARSGEIEAYGRLGINDRFNASSQHNCRVRVLETAEGLTKVEFEVRQQVEERTGAGQYRQSEQELPEGGIHERFFLEIETRLSAEK